MTYRLILAVSYDDSPALQITDHPHGRAVRKALLGAVDIDDAGWEKIHAYLESPAIGAAYTVKDTDTDEPVAYIIRTA